MKADRNKPWLASKDECINVILFDQCPGIRSSFFDERDSLSSFRDLGLSIDGIKPLVWIFVTKLQYPLMRGVGMGMLNFRNRVHKKADKHIEIGVTTPFPLPPLQHRQGGGG